MSVHKRILNKMNRSQRAYCGVSCKASDLSELWAAVTCNECLRKREGDPVQLRVLAKQTERELNRKLRR